MKDDLYDDYVDEEMPKRQNDGPVFRRQNPDLEFDRSEYTEPRSAKEAFQSNKKKIIAMIAATAWCLFWFFLMIFGKVPRWVMNVMILPLVVAAVIAYYRYKKDHDV